jgi:hypothetical protein
VFFDWFGGFSGFILENCCARRPFAGSRGGIGDLMLRALKERFTLMVTVGQDNKIVGVMVKG